MEGPDRAVLSSSLGRMTACRGGSSVGRVVAGGGGLRGKRKKWPWDTSRLQKLFVSTWVLTWIQVLIIAAFVIALLQPAGDVILFSNYRVGIATGLNRTVRVLMRRVRVNIQCDTQPFCTAAFFVPQTRLFPRRPTAWPYQQRLFCGWKKLCWALESIVSALVTTTPISSQVIWAVATWSVVIYGMVWSKWRRWECGRIHPLTMSHLSRYD